MMAITGDSGGAAARKEADKPGAAGDIAKRMRRLLATVALVLIAVIAIEQLELTPHYPMTRKLMQTQDMPVIVLVAALLLAMAAVRLPRAWGQWAKIIATRTPFSFFVLLLVAVLVVVVGTRHITRDTPVSHDENMAQFDTAIIASGRLLAPIQPEWLSLS